MLLGTFTLWHILEGGVYSALPYRHGQKMPKGPAFQKRRQDRIHRKDDVSSTCLGAVADAEVPHLFLYLSHFGTSLATRISVGAPSASRVPVGSCKTKLRFSLCKEVKLKRKAVRLLELLMRYWLCERRGGAQLQRNLRTLEIFRHPYSRQQSHN